MGGGVVVILAEVMRAPVVGSLHLLFCTEFTFSYMEGELLRVRFVLWHQGQCIYGAYLSVNIKPYYLILA